MEPRSIYQSCPEHGSGCVAIVHLEPGVRSMHGVPAWVERWQQHYPGMGVVAIEHVTPTMPPRVEVAVIEEEPEPEVEKKRWWRRK